MNTLEQISIRSPADKDETCAKFVIDDISFPFVFHEVTKAGQQYTLGFYVKSETAGSLTIFDKVYNTTTEWQKLAITFDATDVNIPIFFSTLGTYYFYHTQLEIGNKDTDFERAPEDIEEDIQSVSKKTAELIVDLDAITSRVYSVEQDTTSLESRVSVAESKLTKDSLTTIIGSYYTTLGQLNNAIDGIDIGGRNLIRGTKDMSGFYTNSANMITDEDGFTFASFSPSSLDYWKLESTVHPISFSVVRNKEVVLSFYARSDDWESLNASASNGILLTFVLCDAESTTKLRSRDVELYTCNLSNEWQKIFITATLSDDYFTSGSGTIDDTTRIYIRFNNYSAYSMQVKQFKLELGNKATDWTPAPEDMDAEISYAKTLATQTADKFNWLVQDDITADATSFTLTPRTATLIAQTISLNGDVKVNGDMLVDGIITTDKLAANAVTASKIDVEDLFAQDITATGTITGVTLKGSYGEIGGWSLENCCLYSRKLYSTGLETTVVLQNINNFIRSTNTTGNDCDVTRIGDSVIVTPSANGSITLNVNIPVSSGSYQLVIYSGYRAAGNTDDTMSGMYSIDDGGDILTDMIITFESDIRRPNTYIFDVEIEENIASENFTVMYTMPNAIAGTEYSFTFYMTKDGTTIPNDMSIINGLETGTVFGIKRDDGESISIPLYITSEGFLYAENADITGVVKVSSSSSRSLTITRIGSNGASIGFVNDLGALGAIGMEAVDGNLLRWNSTGNAAYTILDTGNYTTTLDARYLKLSGGTITGDLTVTGLLSGTIGANSLKTVQAGGWYTDNWGNFRHGSDTATNTWSIINYAGTVTFKVNYESGLVTLSSGLSLPNSGTNWVGGMTTTSCIYNSTAFSTGSYHPLIRMNTNAGHVWNLGGYVNEVGFYGYYAGRTANGYDWRTTWNVADGTLTHSKNLEVTGTITSGNTVTIARTDATNAQLYVQNSLRKGRIVANSSGHLGFYDDTNAQWLIYNHYTSGITYVTASAYVLLQASGFALRIGHGQDTSYDVVIPVTTANAVNNGNVFLGAASSRFKILYASQSTNVSSDERDKNITELDDRYLNAFNKLKVVTYRWKNDPEKLHIGLSAQKTKRAMMDSGIDTSDMGAISHDFWTDDQTGEEMERYSLVYEELAMLTIPVVQKHSVTLTDHAAKLVNIEAQLESLKTELDEAHVKIAEQSKAMDAQNEVLMKQQKLIEALQSAS